MIALDIYTTSTIERIFVIVVVTVIQQQMNAKTEKRQKAVNLSKRRFSVTCANKIN